MFFEKGIVLLSRDCMYIYINMIKYVYIYIYVCINVNILHSGQSCVEANNVPKPLSEMTTARLLSQRFGCHRDAAFNLI